jgi:hypothetical protein
MKTIPSPYHTSNTEVDSTIVDSYRYALLNDRDTFWEMRR